MVFQQMIEHVPSGRARLLPSLFSAFRRKGSAGASPSRPMGGESALDLPIVVGQK